MINTNTFKCATLIDLRYAISEANPTMFKDLTTKELKYMLRRVLPIKIDKAQMGTLVCGSIIIKALYEDITQSDIPDTLNVYLDTWQETIAKFYQEYCLTGQSIFFIID